MLNQVLEATLAVMILLLALSVAAIVRIGPMPQAATESNTDTEADTQQPMRVVAAPGQMVATASAPARWSNPVPGSMRSPAPPGVRRSGLLGGRYEARHVRGRMPKPRPPAPAGPPWGPASPPPSRPQQSSERWT